MTILNTITQRLDNLQKEAEQYTGQEFSDRIEACRMEFQYMSDFMMKGFKDEKRGELFTQLFQRIEDIAYDIEVYSTMRNLYTTTPHISAPGNTEADETKEYEISRYRNIEDSFRSLLVSGHWTRSMAETFANEIVDNTDIVATAPKVSALSISAIEHFHVEKAVGLAMIYRRLSQEPERQFIAQRAFVGCMLTLSRTTDEQTADRATVLDILACDNGNMRNVLELQAQMVSCANVDNDIKEIRSEIMPNIIRNQPFTITRNGIIEKNDSPTTDYDPEEENSKIDAMEKSVDRILKMQRNGADIFFEGFSQMKRFPFFRNLLNWFIPFYKQHPDVAAIPQEVLNSKFVDRITKQGPFCESDKYSFVIAMTSVMRSLPENVRSMMDGGELGPIGMRKEGDPGNDASIIRLQYLQDLYRFYRLSPVASNLYNPFAELSQCSLWITILDRISDVEKKDMCLYLTKKDGATSTKKAIERILNNFNDNEGFDRCISHAEFRMLTKDYDTAIEQYSKCLSIKPDSKVCMRGIARAYYSNGDYDKAAFYYDALHTLQPERRSYLLNYCMAMVMDGKASDVLNELYRLDFETPDDPTVLNTLTWALLYAGKADKALVTAKKIEHSKDLSALLNVAYTYMANGMFAEAIDRLRTYATNLDEEKRKDFPTLLLQNMKEDAPLLATFHIGQAEQAIIAAQMEQSIS